MCISGFVEVNLGCNFVSVFFIVVYFCIFFSFNLFVISSCSYYCSFFVAVVVGCCFLNFCYFMAPYYVSFVVITSASLQYRRRQIQLL